MFNRCRACFLIYLFLSSTLGEVAASSCLPNITSVLNLDGLLTAIASLLGFSNPNNAYPTTLMFTVVGNSDLQISSSKSLDLVGSNDCNTIERKGVLEVWSDGKLFAHNGFNIEGAVSLAGNAILSGKSIREFGGALTNMLSPHRLLNGGTVSIHGTNNIFQDGCLFDLVGGTFKIFENSQLLVKTGSVIKSVVNHLVDVAGDLVLSDASLIGVSVGVNGSTASLTISGSGAQIINTAITSGSNAKWVVMPSSSITATNTTFNGDASSSVIVNLLGSLLMSGAGIATAGSVVCQGSITLPSLIGTAPSFSASVELGGTLSAASASLNGGLLSVSGTANLGDLNAGLGSVKVLANGNLGVGSLLSIDGTLEVNGGSLTAGTIVSTGQPIAITGGGSISVTGSLSTTKGIDIGVSSSLNAGILNITNADLKVVGSLVGGSLELSASVGADLDVTGLAGLDQVNLTNVALKVAADGLLSVNNSLTITGSLEVNAGSLKADAVIAVGNPINVTNGGLLSVTGSLSSADGIEVGVSSTLEAGILKLINTTLEVAGSLVANSLEVHGNASRVGVSGVMDLLQATLSGVLLDVKLDAALKVANLSLSACTAIFEGQLLAAGLKVENGILNITTAANIGGSGLDISAAVVHLAGELNIDSISLNSGGLSLGLGTTLEVGELKLLDGSLDLDLGTNVTAQLITANIPLNVGSLLQTVGGLFTAPLVITGVVKGEELQLDSATFLQGVIDASNGTVVNTGTLTMVGPAEETRVIGALTNNGTLKGNGTVDGTLENNGRIISTATDHSHIRSIDFISSDTAIMKTTVTLDGSTTTVDANNAVLDGELEIFIKGEHPTDSVYPIITADSTSGKFSSVQIVYENEPAECAPHATTITHKGGLAVVFGLPADCNSNVIAGTNLSLPAFVAIVAVAGAVLLVVIFIIVAITVKPLRRKIFPFMVRSF